MPTPSQVVDVSQLPSITLDGDSVVSGSTQGPCRSNFSSFDKLRSSRVT